MHGTPEHLGRTGRANRSTPTRNNHRVTSRRSPCFAFTLRARMGFRYNPVCARALEIRISSIFSRYRGLRAQEVREARAVECRVAADARPSMDGYSWASSGLQWTIDATLARLPGGIEACLRSIRGTDAVESRRDTSLTPPSDKRRTCTNRLGDIHGIATTQAERRLSPRR